MIWCLATTMHTLAYISIIAYNGWIVKCLCTPGYENGAGTVVSWDQTTACRTEGNNGLIETPSPRRHQSNQRGMHLAIITQVMFLYRLEHAVCKKDTISIHGSAKLHAID